MIYSIEQLNILLIYRKGPVINGIDNASIIDP